MTTEALTAAKLLPYLWIATGKNPDIRVCDLFNENDPLVADVERVLRAAASPSAEGLDAPAIHRILAADDLLPDCGGTHAMGYAYCQRIALALAQPAEDVIQDANGDEIERGEPDPEVAP